MEAGIFPRAGFGGFLKTGHRPGSRVPSKPCHSYLEEHEAGSRRMHRCEAKSPKDRHSPMDGHISFRFAPAGFLVTRVVKGVF